jgi:phage gp29-like protein
MNGLIDTLIWVFVISLFSLGCLAVFIVIYAVIAVMIQDRKNKDDDKE